MSSVWNGAYSAPRGYDLRAPYNVPGGEIKVFRVVAPFSVSSTQKNTLVEGFPSAQCHSSQGFPPLHPGRTYHHFAGMDPCTENARFYTVENQHPPYAQLVLEKLYLKNSRIK